MMTDSNLVQMRVLLLVGRRHWTEAMDLAREKILPEHTRRRAVALATGAGTLNIRLTWADATSSAAELSRLGVGVDNPSSTIHSVPVPEVLRRLISFTLAVMEEKSWQYLHESEIYPGKFALLLHEDRDQADAFMTDVHEDVEHVFFFEQAHHLIEGFSDVWQEVSWSKTVFNQYLFRLIAHSRGKFSDAIKGFLLRWANTIGDTRLIEDTHCFVRDIYRDSKHRQRSPTTEYA